MNHINSIILYILTVPSQVPTLCVRRVSFHCDATKLYMCLGMKIFRHGERLQIASAAKISIQLGLAVRMHGHDPGLADIPIPCKLTRNLSMFIIVWMY